MLAIFIQDIIAETKLTRHWNVRDQIDTIKKLGTEYVVYPLIKHPNFLPFTYLNYLNKINKQKKKKNHHITTITRPQPQLFCFMSNVTVKNYFTTQLLMWQIITSFNLSQLLTSPFYLPIRQ